MKLIKYIGLWSTVCILSLQCGISNEEPGLGSFDAYPSLLNESIRTFDLTSVENSNYDYCVEFIDQTDGSSIQLYEIEAQFIDNNLDNGDLSSESRIVQRFSADNFSIGSNGRLSMCNSMSFTVLIGEFDLNREDPLEGDMFMMRTYLTTTDGQRLGADNTSTPAEVHFDFSITIISS